MALQLIDQGAAVNDSGFRLRVRAGCVKVSLIEFNAPPVSGSAQTQRIALAEAILRDPDYAVTQFCWLLVGLTQFTGIGDIDDNQVKNQIQNNFDQIAQMMMSGGP